MLTGPTSFCAATYTHTLVSIQAPNHQLVPLFEKDKPCRMMHDDPPDHLSEPSPFGLFWGDASQEGLIEDAGTGTANGFAALPDASQVDWRAGRDVERVLARPAKLIWSVPVDVQGTYHSVVLYMHLTFERHLSVEGHQLHRYLRTCWRRH